MGEPEGAGETEIAGGRCTVPGGELAGGAERGRATEQPAGLNIEVTEAPRVEEELTNAVCVPYQPQRLKIPGAKPQPKRDFGV
ncbi:MAG TPA: hypothetical protein DCW46_01385 [Desulfotomaculum sp.]|nr:hypothetical protein [Desulfotomaculum sp.]